MLWTKNPNFYYTPERRSASDTSEPSGGKLGPFTKNPPFVPRAWDSPRVYLSSYLVKWKSNYPFLAIQIWWASSPICEESRQKDTLLQPTPCCNKKKYVTTEENPADILSRGASLLDFYSSIYSVAFRTREVIWSEEMAKMVVSESKLWLSLILPCQKSNSSHARNRYSHQPISL